MYWDKYGRERFPPEHDYREHEFIDQHRDYALFSYTFTNGISPADLVLATHIVDQINSLHPDLGIKIDNASVRGLNPTMTFILKDGAQAERAGGLFKKEYEHKIELLETVLRERQQLLDERKGRIDLAEGQFQSVTALVHKVSNVKKEPGVLWKELSALLSEPLVALLKVAETQPEAIEE